ncbi:uncharacterized protein A1O9_03844 [Exophiala aquamarina CBS 119918]|uniref:Oxidoreductase n=1 Tax=Exophiala aquamarina CBS 119918 TaxID=1182545 RepID=A0A072PGL6_9EURO|nr:uncharacterized protein A1O9_03844 [Exophiala aquamarina CBS 119918]KEF59001.1 hypothetical protein A1O9_03844 [Exophiala aquamarina CBS 119918]
MPQLVWLVTGCSSGFGEQFVLDIIARGDSVIATGRNFDQIKHLEEHGATILQLDLTDPQDVLDEVISAAVKVFGRIDVLVNNASYISIGTWEDLEYSDLVAQFDTNVFGTFKVTRAVLPYFRSQANGMIVFIGSLSGWIGHPGCSAYAGSKFALEGMVEGLTQEVAPFGIKTLLIEPGRFRTNLLSANKMKVRPSKIPDYTEFSKTLLGYLGNEDQRQPGDPRKLVSVILDVVRQEGVATGMDVPIRLPLGSDVYADIKTKCEETLKLLREWEPVIQNTNYSD